MLVKNTKPRRTKTGNKLGVFTNPQTQQEVALGEKLVSDVTELKDAMGHQITGYAIVAWNDWGYGATYQMVEHTKINPSWIPSYAQERLREAFQNQQND